MRKIKKIFAVILSSVLSLGFMMGISSSLIGEALYHDIKIYNPLYAPEGYEEFEDTELYQNYSEYFDYGIVRYRSADDPRLFVFYDYFSFSGVNLKITNDGWEEIYNKYSDELNMDVVKVLDSGNIRITDSVHSGEYETAEEAKAAILERYNAIGEKYGIIMEMCAEMYYAGCIEAADYYPCAVCPAPLYTETFAVENYTGTQEALEAAVKTVNEKATVRQGKYHDGSLYYKIGFSYEGASAEDMFDVIDALDVMEGEHTLNVDIMVSDESVYSVPNISSESIDILAALESQSESSIKIGDLTLDGKIGITDILALSKANADIITLNEAQLTAADCNGDGSVNGSDLTALLSFITEKVDSLPVGAGE